MRTEQTYRAVGKASSRFVTIKSYCNRGFSESPCACYQEMSHMTFAQRRGSVRLILCHGVYLIYFVLLRL